MDDLRYFLGTLEPVWQAFVLLGLIAGWALILVGSVALSWLTALALYTIRRKRKHRK